MDETGYIERALDLARRAEGSVSPRPAVGAVVVSAEGEIVGEGFTQRKPGPHAEAEALDQAGDRARGATVFVTLEPCNIATSKPSSCADALIAAGVRKVVASIIDPCPDVDGRGLARLREAGIEVSTGPGAAAATAVIEPFAKWTTTSMPFVTLKLAASLDGKVAARDGTSRWITGPEARAEVHDLRRRVDAVLVGSMTVLRDDPLLTYRNKTPGTQPLRVVVDGSGRSSAEAKVFNGDAPTLVITSEDLDARFIDAWTAAGADVERVAAGEGGIDPRSALTVLGDRGICHVLVEGGPTIASSFVEHDLVDRFVLYFAPKLIGGEAPGVLNDGVKTLSDAWELDIDAVTRVGMDVRIDARRRRDGT